MTGAHLLTVANRVTILRILGVPIFVLLLMYYMMSLENGRPDELYRWLALGLFCLVAATDALDGYLARSRNEITLLGKLLDPIADKALLLSGLIMLTHPTLPALQPQIPVWFTLLVISRDMVLVLGTVFIRIFVGHVDIKPRMAGKIATCLQMVALVWVLADWAGNYFRIIVDVAGLFTFVSGVIYLFDGIRQLERAPALHKPGDQPHA